MKPQPFEINIGQLLCRVRLSKMKRVLDVLLCGAERNNEDTFEIALRHGVEELTIKRDLTLLRSIGFKIHSVDGKGLELLTPVMPDQIKFLMMRLNQIENSKITVRQIEAPKMKLVK